MIYLCMLGNIILSVFYIGIATGKNSKYCLLLTCIKTDKSFILKPKTAKIKTREIVLLLAEILCEPIKSLITPGA